MRQNQTGFTLVELIVVIVILGILAATALPRFINLQGDAKAASMKGVAGSMRAAVEIVRSKWLVTGSTGATTVTLPDSTTVDVGTTGAAAGVPLATTVGIDRAAGISSTQFTCTGSAPRSCSPLGGPTTCAVTYDPTNGTVDDSAAVVGNC